MTNKKIAIFIPSYNASATIAETLKSVQEAISETSMQIPVFVYDDCSKDDSVDKARSVWQADSKLTIVRNEVNGGERKTTNNAFSGFYGVYDWVFIIHADDMAKKDWITTTISYINKVDQEKYFTIWSSYEALVDQTGEIVPGHDTGEVEDVVRPFKYFLTKVYSNWHISGAAINVNLFHKLNGFDERMPQFGDTDFFVRALQGGLRDVYLARALTIYRLSPASVSSVSSRINRDIREIHLLIEKYKDVLNPKEVSSLYKIIRRLSGRRVLKSMKSLRFSHVVMNLKEFTNSLFK